MARRKQIRPSPPQSPALGDRPRRRRAAWGLALSCVLLAGSGPFVVQAVIRERAASALETGAVYDAQQWIHLSRRLGSRHAELDLLQAACFRQLQQLESWSQAIEAARARHAGAMPIERETRLANTSLGDIPSRGGNPIAELLLAGASSYEITAAYVHGYLRREEPDHARLVLETWARDAPGDPRHGYLQGVIERWLSQPLQAEASFRQVLGKQPRHDPSRAALAQMLEHQNRLGEALAEYVELAKRAPRRAYVELDVARLLRKLGRVDEARTLLHELMKRLEAPEAANLEAGLAEWEAGNFESAAAWLDKSRPGPSETQRLTAAAIVSAMRGMPQQASALFGQLDRFNRQSTRLYDLQVRTLINPADRDAVSEMSSLSQRLAAPVPEPPALATPGKELYREHCAVCHGEQGDGHGPAARYLCPRPRNLRRSSLRLVSGSQGVATVDDLRTVIRQGIPGTSMTAQLDLSPAEVEALVEEVQRLRREGLSEILVAQAADAGLEPPTEEEITATQSARLITSAAVVPPSFPPPDSAALQRGAKVYADAGCAGCHGPDGTGQSGTHYFDEQGEPSRPRDLVHEPFKSGSEPAAVFLRVRLGMPGTVHPACASLSEAELIDLTLFCRSLSSSPQLSLTNYDRETAGTAEAHR
ncbi:MAG: c-type cytochrome [Pirellulaceae bacterium]